MNSNKQSSVIKEFLLTILVILLFAWVLFVFVTYISVYHASEQLTQPTQQEFLRVKLYGSSSSSDGNTISGSFSIIDTAGNEITAIERSWTGNYLSVEFTEATFKDKFYIFPVRIYGKERILETNKDRKGGTLLEKYYDDNNQCLLLGYGSSLYERQELYRIARFTTKKLLVVPDFGHTTTFSIDLSECKNDVYYSIQILSDGRVVVKEI